MCCICMEEAGFGGFVTAFCSIRAATKGYIARTGQGSAVLEVARIWV